ncbi:Minf_1886 family protein [Chlamydiota bacterium]
MTEKKYFTILEKQIVLDNSKYDVDAYQFVLEALNHFLKKLKKVRHISGKELLKGIKEFGLKEYGPMAKTVFNHWGVNTCEDFGEIVFSLIENGLLKKNDNDSLEDFTNGYDFKEAFEKPFIT